ncbi:hypothetical protein QTP88_009436 [Uroleucon formosanum]
MYLFKHIWRADTPSPPSTEGMACTFSSIQPKNSPNITKIIGSRRTNLIMFPSNHVEVYLNTCIYNETGRRTYPEKMAIYLLTKQRSYLNIQIQYWHNFLICIKYLTILSIGAMNSLNFRECLKLLYDAKSPYISGLPRSMDHYI